MAMTQLLTSSLLFDTYLFFVLLKVKYIELFFFVYIFRGIYILFNKIKVFPVKQLKLFR